MSINIKIFNAGALQPGGVLEGKVVCILNTRKDIRGIRLQVGGREHTSWEKSESYYDNEAKETKWKTVHYYGDNTVLAIQETLHGAGLIELGKHEFPFRFVLPKKIPSSYNGAHGSIRYYLKANVDIPMAPDYKDEKRFIVEAPIDFNKMRYQLQLDPTQYQDETNLCCCCCASDPITLEVHLEKEAFVIGEVIKMKVHMLNMSNKSLEGLTLQLIRVITEKCTSPQSDEKIETEIVASYGNTGVGAHGDRDYSPELRIPSGFKLPNFKCCKLFSQRFEIKVEATIPGCHSNMKMEIPVKVGHIPVSTQPATNTVSSTDPFPQAPPSYPPADPAPPNSAKSVSSPPNSIGFAVKDLPPAFPGLPGINLPRVHGMPTPFSPGAPSLPTRNSASYPVANAPRDETAPSAPDLAEKNDLISLDDPHGNEPPPPSYYDALRN